MHAGSVDSAPPREGYLPSGMGRLFYRHIGCGRPTIVLHGGPDFSHSYLLPELDRLSDVLNLVYYDQRGRGRSWTGERAEDIGIDSEIADVERVRGHFAFEKVGILGHSWGGILAMEYATRHPDRVSHVILMNTSPASHKEILGLRRGRRRTEADALDEMARIAATPEYKTGRIDVEARYYRLHFRATIRSDALLDEVVRRLRRDFTPESIVTARAIEDRLYEQTWNGKGYDLVSKLEQLRVPALVVHGDYDIVPVACAERIARAIPGARLAVLEDCGHFVYLEKPEEVRRIVGDFLKDDPE